CVLWFSAISPNFHIRLIVVSAVWIFLMLASALTLLNSRTEDTSLSRWVLFGIFSVVAFYTLCRLAIYLVMGLSSDFAIESGVNWLNLLSPILMTLLPVVGTTAFLLMCSDKLRRQLEIAAATDYLTGLPNRRMLALLSTRGFEQATKQGGDFAVAVLDIDNFKAINDTHGHDAGDMVLVGVVDQFRGHADKVDMIARTGGEEFTVLFSGVPPNRVAETIEAVRSAVEAAAIYAGNIRIPVTISAGIAMYNPDDAMFEDMLRRADQALYSAKMAGRNRVEFPMSNVRPVEPGCIADDRQHLGA
ncbi:MAG: GGDEF domain-containing protein, partial [Rhizobium sp.]